VGDVVELPRTASSSAGCRWPDVAPERGDTVQIATPVGVDQLGPVGRLDHQRLHSNPITLLREGVPKMIVIEPGSLLHLPLANICAPPDVSPAAHM
jgi:hypothetical protein